MEEQSVTTEVTAGGESSPENVEQVEQNAESTAAESQQTEAEQKPKYDPVQRRINNLTREKYQLRAELEQLRKQVAEVSQPRQPTQAQGAPKLEQFQSFDEYVAAVSEWKAEQKFSELTTAQQRAYQEAQQRQQAAATTQAWESRLNEARKGTPDYDEIIESADVQVTQAMGRAILDSEQGPMVALYLARNPEEADRIAALNSDAAVARAIGRIEAKLEAEELVKKQSSAPKPASAVRGTAGPASSLDTQDIATFMKLRRQQIAARH